jgi:hypothetical protein
VVLKRASAVPAASVLTLTLSLPALSRTIVRPAGARALDVDRIEPAAAAHVASSGEVPIVTLITSLAVPAVSVTCSTSLASATLKPAREAELSLIVQVAAAVSALASMMTLSMKLLDPPSPLTTCWRWRSCPPA